MIRVLVNLNRIRNTFTFNDEDSILQQMKQCKTARELRKRFPKTYKKILNGIVDYAIKLNPMLGENLMDSPEFFNGVYATRILNRYD